VKNKKKTVIKILQGSAVKQNELGGSISSVAMGGPTMLGHGIRAD